VQYKNLFLITAALVPACTTNDEGNLAAGTVGDTSNPAERGSALEELQDACGDGAMATALVARQPYLQQVTTSSAIIGWTTTAPGAQAVLVSAPDGTAVGTFGADQEHGAIVKTPGERLLWSKVSGLEPDTIYCYQVADSGPLMARAGFRTAPPADSTEPIRFLAFGDSGYGGPDQLRLRDEMYDFPYRFIIHTGDLAYDQGTIDQFDSLVFGVYQNLFVSLPFFPAVGNHEYGTPDAGPYRAAFNLPGGGGERWYSYDWGRIHFAVLDTEQDLPTQMNWLAEDLAASTAPWKIVYLHKPPYSSGEHGSDRPLRDLLAPIVEANDVQLVMAGHDHDYERTEPQNGVVYVVTGGGGRGTRIVSESAFTAFSEAVIHFVYAELDGDELILHAIDGTGVEFDSVVIPRVRN
jgi:hypothetical protein